VRQDAQGAMPSMVLGIVSIVLTPFGCCCGVGEVVVIPLGIVAIVLGVNARNRVAASQGMLGGEGKALAGIITGATAAGIGLVLLVLTILWFGVSSSGLLNGIPSPTPFSSA
jgi:hypothetical protein